MRSTRTPALSAPSRARETVAARPSGMPGCRGTPARELMERGPVTISPSAEGAPDVLDATQAGLSVSRTALTDRLSTADWATVVLLSGPAGAGKSTLAHQWATIEGRPHARLRLAAHLDEPAALAEAVVGALEAVGPSEPLARAVLTGQEPTFSSVVLPGLAAIASTRATSYVLVLDDLHLLRHPDCIRLVRTLADSVPRGSMLALLSREAAPSWLARLRAEQRLLELTADDLAFDAEELDGLLDLLGISLRPVDREALLDRTEGWAVALYLEALALRKSRRIVPRQGEPRMSSDVSFVGDYIQTEILDAVPRETREFLLRTSILDDIEPEACDALLDRTDSRQVLEALRRSTPLVTPSDAECSSYRYHHLLHDTLRSLMANTSDTALVATLHSRAADWTSGRVTSTRRCVTPATPVTLTRPPRSSGLTWCSRSPRAGPIASLVGSTKRPPTRCRRTAGCPWRPLGLRCSPPTATRCAAGSCGRRYTPGATGRAG